MGVACIFLFSLGSLDVMSDVLFSSTFHLTLIILFAMLFILPCSVYRSQPDRQSVAFVCVLHVSSEDGRMTSNLIHTLVLVHLVVCIWASQADVVHLAVGVGVGVSVFVCFAEGLYVGMCAFWAGGRCCWLVRRELFLRLARSDNHLRRRWDGGGGRW